MWIKVRLLVDFVKITHYPTIEVKQWKHPKEAKHHLFYKAVSDLAGFIDYKCIKLVQTSSKVFF